MQLNVRMLHQNMLPHVDDHSSYYLYYGHNNSENNNNSVYDDNCLHDQANDLCTH
jgi:hypothetical protein